MGFKMDRKIKLVSAGIQKNNLVITDKHLEDIVKNYNPDAQVPITLGHPSDSRAPAFGRVTSIKKNGGALVGNVKLTPVLTELDKDGYYQSWSTGLRKKPDGSWYLHHLAWLGELPPASDVEYVNFNDDDIKDMICLDINERGSMMDDEKIKQIILNEMKKKTDLKIEELEKKLKELSDKVSKAKDENDKTNVSKAKDENNENDKTKEKAEGKPHEDVDGLKKELSTILNTMKTDRMAQIKDVLKRKGLGDQVIQPLMDVIEKYPSIDLADNMENGVYKKLLTFANGLKDANNNKLLGSLMNFDAGDDNNKFEFDAEKLARKL